jgi:hypothetical protein
MKDCPRCGSSLSHYALADGEAYGCDACGWVGVDVEHRSKPATLESWHDAISRFESKFARDGSENAVRNLERVRDNVDIPNDAPESDPKPHVERVPSDAEEAHADSDAEEAHAEAADTSDAEEAHAEAADTSDADASSTDDPDETPASADQDEESDEYETDADDDEPVAADEQTDEVESESTDEDGDDRPTDDVESSSTDDDDPDADALEEDAAAEVA